MRRVDGKARQVSEWRRALRDQRRRSAPLGRKKLSGSLRVLRSKVAETRLSPSDRLRLESAIASEKSARREADAAHSRLVEAIDMLPEGILFLDEHGRYVLWNKRYEEIYQVSADLFKVGRSFKEALSLGVWRGDYPEAAGREQEWLEERFAKLDQPKGRHEQWLRDGRCILIEERQLAAGGTIGLRVDITELKQREASFRHLFEANPLALIVIAGDDQRIVSANEAALTLYGYTLEELRAMTLADLHGSIGEAQLHDVVNSCCNGQDTWLCYKKDGSPIEVAVYSRPLVYDQVPAVLFSAVDVTERRRAEEQITFISRHDALTGLPNRAAVMDAIEDMLKRGSGGSVLTIGIDHFKAVNETLGHSGGDTLLSGFAKRLSEMLHSGEFVGRLGSDEFCVVLRDSLDAHQLSMVARRLTKGLTTPFPIGDSQIRVTVSIGIARAPSDGETAGGLLKSADLALSHAKRTGRGSFKLFQPDLNERSSLRRKLEADLRHAVANRDLEVHYQPLVDLGTGRLAGAEALVRWCHPERGYISPAEFVPVAEDLGLIDQLGTHVLLTACRDAQSWPESMRVSVNFSPLQFRSNDVLAVVQGALRSTGLAPQRLEVEITETVFMENTDQVLRTLHELRALGVRIAMDDFGTGYSSLGYLCRFPFDKIKIDRSFVRDIGANADQQAVVLAVMGLGRALGKVIVAEGIETMDDLDCLKVAGCHQGQGYLFSRPVPVDEFCEVLAVLAPKDAAVA